jgi:hypothetical protein
MNPLTSFQQNSSGSLAVPKQKANSYASSVLLAVVKIAYVLLFWCTSAVMQPQEVLAAVSSQPLLLTNVQNEQISKQQLKPEAAEQASKDIFRGLDRAKEQVGETETRKQAMEFGHQKASEKLEDLANRAEAAQSPEDLNPAERNFLKNL